MKILLHSFTFWPAGGGVENVSRTLADTWTALGHKVTVITETPSETEQALPYAVVRNPEVERAHELIDQHDLVHSNGASIRYFWPARQSGKPFTWTHPAYQAISIDGFGWVDSAPAPMSPLASMIHHGKLFGPVAAAKGGAKLLCRQAVAHMVDANVAVSYHQARWHQLPRQRVIYNPIDLKLFATANFETAVRELQESSNTLAFLGRLITEKGVSDLLQAFAKLPAEVKGNLVTLKVIGDGPRREQLQSLAQQLKVSERVCWTGWKSGEDLAKEIRSSGIFVLPSAWLEPMGLTAVELMSAGKPIIVSATGGLAECAGDAGMTFANQDIDALTRSIQTVLEDQSLQHRMIARGLERVEDFDTLSLCRQYLDLFAELLGRYQAP